LTFKGVLLLGGLVSPQGSINPAMTLAGAVAGVSPVRHNMRLG
jgi:osmotically-inducible protein OsmY